MSVAGPSRLRPPAWRTGVAPKGNVQGTSAYERDLLGLLAQLSLEERDEFQGSLLRRISAGGRLSDREVALNDLIQQARTLDALNQDQMLAERIATQEDSDVDEVGQVPWGGGKADPASSLAWAADEEADEAPEVETPQEASQSKNKRKKRKRKKRQQQGEAGQDSSIPDVLPQSSNKSMEKKRMDNQHTEVTSMWAKGPPPLSNAKEKDAKGKGKQHPTSSSLWKTGDPFPLHPAPYSQPSPELSPVNANSVVPKTPKVNRPTGHDCVICQDPIYGTEIKASCGHYYDISCITDLFKFATRDETLFPPRCCRKNIPFTQVQPHLSQALITTFREKQVEFGTLKRVYCSSPTCSRFLGPLSEGGSTRKMYICPAWGCGRRTCAKCREQYTSEWAHVCRPDAGATEVLQLSRESGWARCPGCSQMIELNFGCFHMTCRCQTEFCYLCRIRWKRCQCRQWDEDRLFAAAEQRVDAQLGADREQGTQLVTRPLPATAVERNPFSILDEQPANPSLVQQRDEEQLFRFPTTVAATRNPFGILDEQPAPPHTDPARWPALTPTATTISSPTRPSNAWTTVGRQWRTVEAPATTTKSPTNTTAIASTSSSPLAPTSTFGQAYLPGFASISESMRERLIREMMEVLRLDHDCDHFRWRYQDSGGHCESCGCYLPTYLFRCQDCEMLACNRCRRNRL